MMNELQKNAAMRGKIAHEAFDKFMSENPRCNDERSSLHYWDPLFEEKGTVTLKKSGVVTARVELEEAALSEAWIQKDAARLHKAGPRPTHNDR